jgi:putative membrane protein
MMSSSIFAGALTLATVFGAAAGAAERSKPPRRDGGVDAIPIVAPLPARTVSASDRATIQKVHDANQLQVQIGQLARDKGASKGSRELGARLVTNRSRLERDLDDYLRRRGGDLRALATVSNADADHELLATKTGVDFDRAFATLVIQDHTKLIDLVESARIETPDADLRLLFDQMLPVLQGDKRAAQDVLASTARS